MMSRAVSRFLLPAALLLSMVVVVPTASSTDQIGSGNSTSAGRAADSGAADTDAERPDERSVNMRGELVELADAWALGGGTYGFPFWEKAGQRWRAGQITSTMYREYVDGYRDRLLAGCELLDVIDPDEQASGDVRALVLDACRKRVEALRAQHRWLDAIIKQDFAAPGEDVVALQETARTGELEFRAAIEESYRDARLAMNTAQSALDQAGLERLSEGAFV
jgi:hypothetical protein